MNYLSRRAFAVLLPMSFASLPLVLSARNFLPASGQQEMDRIRAAMKKSAAKGWSFVGMQRVVSDPASVPPWSRQIRSLTGSNGYVVLFQGSVTASAESTHGPLVQAHVPGETSFLAEPAQTRGKGEPGKGEPGRGGPDNPGRRVQVWLIEWPGAASLPKAQDDLRQNQMAQEGHPVLIGYDSRYLAAAVGDVGDGRETLLKAMHSLNLKAVTGE